MKKITVLLVAVIAFLGINANAQWTLQGTVTGLGSYPSISVYSSTGVVVAGGLGSTPSAKVYRSTNSGQNWIDISGDLPPNRLYALWAVNENLIFVGDGGAPPSTGAKMWKTTNGGANWSLVLTTGVDGFFNGIVFSRTHPMIGIAVSDPTPSGGEHYLAKTTDGGNNWFTQSTIATGGPGTSHTVICIDNMFYGWGIASGIGQKRFILTTNGGLTFSVVSVNLPGNDNAITGLAFSSDKSTAIAGTYSNLPIISRSIDGGTSWSTIGTGLPITTSTVVRMKWVYGTNWCYLSGDTGTSGCVGKSTNGGLNWSVMSTADVNRIYHLELVHNAGHVYAYAISKDGRIIRLQETITTIQKGENEVPVHFNLSQNYPNPFNPETKIRFDIPKSSFTKLTVYDVTGRVMAIVVNEDLKPGTYEADWNASNYPSGVYFYKLSTKNYSESRRMVLIK